MHQTQDGVFRNLFMFVVERIGVVKQKIDLSEDKTSPCEKCYNFVYGVKDRGKNGWGGGVLAVHVLNGDSLCKLTAFHRNPSYVHAVRSLGLFFKALTSFKVTPVTALQHHNEFKK